MSQNPSGQIPLNLAPQPNYTFERYEIGPSNEAAVKAVRSFPDWPAPILALVGPSGSGKTHLSRAWAACNDAVVIETQQLSYVNTLDLPVLIEDASSEEENLLFTLMNMALNGDIPGLLLTSDKSPAEWNVDMPDLRSRLKNLAVTTLGDPDDTILELIVRKLFDDQGREVSRDLVEYLLAYQDRSVIAMKSLAAQLDRAAREGKSDLTKAFAARYFAQQKNQDLFSD